MRIGPYGITLCLLCTLLAASSTSSAQVGADDRSLYARGHEALGRGEIGSAIELLEEARREDPSGLEILLDLATAYEQGKDSEKAESLYREALRQDPSSERARKGLERLGSIGWNQQTLLDKADELLARQRFSEAAYLYKRFLAESPESSRAREGVRHCEEGLAALSAAPASPPESPRVDAPPSAGRLGAPSRGDELEPIATETTPDLQAALESRTGASEPEHLARGAQEKVAALEDAAIEALPQPADSGADRAADAPDLPSSATDDEAAGDLAMPVPSQAEESPTTVTTRSRGEPAQSAAPSSRASEPTSLISGIAAALAVLVVASSVGFLVWWYRRRCTIRGVIEQFPLPDLMQWLGLSKKVGLLKIHSATASGRVFLEEGKIVHADWSGEEGELALHRILALPKGSFVFRERAIPRGLSRSLDLAVQQALMNWAYQQDEESRQETTAELSNPLGSVDDESLNLDLPF